MEEFTLINEQAHEKTFKFVRTNDHADSFHNILTHIEQDYIRIRTEHDNERTTQHVINVIGRNREGRIRDSSLHMGGRTRGPITTDLNIHRCHNTDFLPPIGIYCKILYAEEEDYEEYQNYDYGDEETEISIIQDIVPQTLPPIRENKCCVCLIKKPNILYCDCRHISTCQTCDEKGKFKRCPMCRTELKTNKIIL